MNMKLRLFVCLMALSGAAAAGCTSDPVQLESEPTPSTAEAAVHPEIGETFQLSPGEVASVENGDLLIAFRSVGQDSRCPSDVTCVWAGDAEIHLGTAREGGPWSWSVLHTTIEPMSLQVEGFVLEVVGLDPVPVSTAPIPQSAYRVSLRVTRP